MALTFAKKAKPAASASAQTEHHQPAQKSKSSGGTISFLKTGQAAHKAMAAEEAKAELAKQEAGKMWRFRMAPGEDRKITFLDGSLDENNMLAVPMFYEHTLQVGGKWKNFVCTDEQEPCPICAKGDDKPALVGVMTVLDHTPAVIKSGPKAGQTIQHTRKLFVAKKDTIAMLTKIAVKRGGLTGCTFDVARGGEKTAAVGSQFDFTEKLDLTVIAKKYGLKLEEAQPADYQAEIVYHTAAELLELGIGKAASGPGYEKSSGGSVKDEL